MEEKKKHFGAQKKAEKDKKKRRNFTMSQDFLDRLDRLVPEGKRSYWIQQVISRELDVIEGLKSTV